MVSGFGESIMVGGHQQLNSDYLNIVTIKVPQGAHLRVVCIAVSMSCLVFPQHLVKFVAALFLFYGEFFSAFLSAVSVFS